MAKLAKPEWVKFNFHRVKASPTWGMVDYLWCWYTKLWINCYDSDNPGYLPYDVDVLWKLAGARTKIFFQREGMSLVDRYFKRTEDGLWIYHPKVLETLTNFHTTENLSTKKKKIKIPLISDLDSGLLLLIYRDYPIHVAKKYTLECLEKAISRHAHENKLDALSATQFIHEAVLEFAKSDAGREHGLFVNYRPPNPSTWLNQGRYLDDRKDWYVNKRQTEAEVGKHQPRKVEAQQGLSDDEMEAMVDMSDDEVRKRIGVNATLWGELKDYRYARKKAK